MTRTVNQQLRQVNAQPRPKGKLETLPSNELRLPVGSPHLRMSRRAPCVRAFRAVLSIVALPDCDAEMA
jgi:hypothetical protein